MKVNNNTIFCWVRPECYQAINFIFEYIQKPKESGQVRW
jgi:hypothetical protein